MRNKRYNIFEGREFSGVADDEAPLSIWERRDVYFITKYAYHETLVYLEDEGFGGISLWGHETRFGAPLWEQEEGDSQYIATITFKKPGTTHESFRYAPEYGHENYMVVDLDVEQRDRIIDLLRNEGPVYIFVFHRGRPEREITWAWVGTGGCHPEDVGEGEG